METGVLAAPDGDPTTHSEDGQIEFNCPPTPDDPGDPPRGAALHEKQGITSSTSLLEWSRALAEFVAHMTRLNRGRAFHATSEHLGEYFLVDFVGRRTKHVS